MATEYCENSQNTIDSSINSNQSSVSTAISWNVETVVQCQRKENAKCLIEDSSL